MTETVVVPDGLAGMPAGAGLAAALHALPLGAVPNDRMLEVLRAQYRQLSHEQARMAATLVELARCDGIHGPGVVSRTVGADELAVHETRAALRWTRSAAEAEHGLAEAVAAVPELFAAWEAGAIDRPRVLVFERYLLGLSDQQIAAVCAAALPRAPGLTTGQLAALLRRLVTEVDPDAAARWYRRGVRERTVHAYLAPDGTVTMTACGLPPDEAEAACKRVEALAGRVKRAGHPGRVGQIRSEVYLGLLDGRLHGLTDEDIAALLLASPRRPEDTADLVPTGTPDPRSDQEGAPDENGTDGTGPDDGGTDGAGPYDTEPDGTGSDGTGSDGTGADGAGPDGTGPHGTGPEGGPDGTGADGAGPDDTGSDDTGSDDTGSDDAGSDDAGSDDAGSDDAGLDDAGLDDTGPDDTGADGAGVGASSVAAVPVGAGTRGGGRSGDGSVAVGRGASRTGADRRQGIEIRAALSTLLGLDDRPGEIPGLGPVLADQVRARVGLQSAGHWRFAVINAAGRLVSEGYLRRRPGGASRDGPPGGIVEIQIDEELLGRLVAEPAKAGVWAAVVAEAAAKHARYPREAVDLDARPGDRFARGPLRRHTEIRDRTCTLAGVCRRPAHASAQDHGRDYAAGGATVRHNVGPVCAMDHLLKHRAGWEASRAGDPGTVVWRSPLGGEYPATGEFLTGPVLEPRPGPTPPPATELPDHLAHTPILRRTPGRDGPDRDGRDRPDGTDDRARADRPNTEGTPRTPAPPRLPDPPPPF